MKSKQFALGCVMVCLLWAGIALGYVNARQKVETDLCNRGIGYMEQGHFVYEPVFRYAVKKD